MKQLLSSKWNQFVNFKLTGQWLYQVAFVYLVTISYLQTSTFVDFFAPSTLHRLLFFGLAVIAFKIFFLDSHNLPTITGNLLGFILLLVTWRMSHDFMLVVMGTLILGARGVDFRQIVKLYFIVGLTGLVYILISAQLGIIKDLVFIRDTNGAVRHAFGIIYPTDFAAHVLILVMADAYLAFHHLSWRRYVVYGIIALLVMGATNARLDSLAILLIIPVVWIGKRANHSHLLSRFIAGFYWIVPAISAYIVICLAYFYHESNHLMEKANQALSGRLYYGNLAFKRYGVSNFGQAVQEHGWGIGVNAHKVTTANYFFIDASFLRLLIIFGIVVLFVVLTMMTKISWQSIQNNDYALASIMVIVTISAILEQRLVDIAYNPFLLAFLATGTTSLVKKEKDIERVHS